MSKPSAVYSNAVNKSEIQKKFGRNAQDTGSPEMQVAVLTHRINHLNSHFKTHAKDVHSKRGLLQMVGQRRRLLSYLRTTAPDSYTKLIQDLGLRK